MYASNVRISQRDDADLVWLRKKRDREDTMRAILHMTVD